MIETIVTNLPAVFEASARAQSATENTQGEIIANILLDITYLARVTPTELEAALEQALTGIPGIALQNLSVAGVCDQNPCLNGGTCAENEANSNRECKCPPGFTGDSCETPSSDRSFLVGIIVPVVVLVALFLLGLLGFVALLYRRWRSAVLYNSYIGNIYLPERGNDKTQLVNVYSRGRERYRPFHEMDKYKSQSILKNRHLNNQMSYGGIYGKVNHYHKGSAIPSSIGFRPIPRRVGAVLGTETQPNNPYGPSGSSTGNGKSDRRGRNRYRHHPESALSKKGMPFFHERRITFGKEHIEMRKKRSTGSLDRGNRDRSKWRHAERLGRPETRNGAALGDPFSAGRRALLIDGSNHRNNIYLGSGGPSLLESYF